MNSIQEFSPKSSGHLSIIELIDDSARKEIGNILPFNLHFNELGKHTLYVVLKDGKPDGIVHARSEKGKWGLVEIVWYFDLDMKVRDFRFQRCRDRSKKQILSGAFASRLKGKSFFEIRGLLDSEGNLKAESSLGISEEAKPLALATVRSALKTMSVTNIVWDKHLQQLRAPSGKTPKL